MPPSEIFPIFEILGIARRGRDVVDMRDGESDFGRCLMVFAAGSDVVLMGQTRHAGWRGRGGKRDSGVQQDRARLLVSMGMADPRAILSKGVTL